jgi:hypothetical protein
MGGLFHEDPIERSIIVGKITKKKLEKHLKKVHDKEFKKMLRDLVMEAADEQIGDDGADEIAIKDISIEITSEPPGSMASSVKSKGKRSKGKGKGKSKAKSMALMHCVYYCYVRGGTRICRLLFCY